MKYLLCLTEGVVHEVVDTTDWGLMFIEISESDASHFPKAADRRDLSHEELEYTRQQALETASDEQAEQHKTIPIRCLSDKAFTHLLGFHSHD